MSTLWSLRLVFALGIVTLVLVCVDAVLRAREAWRKRRSAQGGVYGVVIDRDGHVLGTYVDPMQPPRRASYVHGPGSVWTGSDPADPTAWAWEGQGATEEEARHAAHRLRQLYVSLLPELRVQRGDEEMSIPPWA
jgi:hypothetical protein